MLVLFHHLQEGATGSAIIATGVQGVTIFFVLSGFLITTKLMQEYEATGSISLRSFYIRRFFRLLPAAWCLLLVIIVIFSIFHVAGPKLWMSILGCLFFFQNYLWPHVIYELSHFWTLSIEEQFYLTWPVLLVLLGPRRGGYVAMTGAIAVSTHRLLDPSSLATPTHSEVRVDALCIGCVAALVLPRVRPYLQPWHTWPALAALVFYFLRIESVPPLGASVSIALILCLTSTFPDSLISRVLDWRFLTICGTFSYSLYLWHMPFMWFPAYHTLSTVPLRLGLTVLLAWISYTYVERPSIRLGSRIAKRTKKAVKVEEESAPSVLH